MNGLASLCYFAAAATCLIPVWVLAMDTAFGGLDPNSIAYILPTASEIVCMILLAIGGAALITRKAVPRVLLMIGPSFSLCLILYLFISWAGRASPLLELPEAFCSLPALRVGFQVSRRTE